ncbi:hypothetical protein MAJHIDBO_00249 [Propionibacterium freudenreichii subsp. shermanii]|nr:hypothetical protein MAJHIDBO_00249 [Propionibacterium freudenreichii subsp. shermanii]SPS08038.1 hypothetical protein MAJHIDBO_00249 [Propionibacterium freudenreichii subsp. shermanii]
MRLTVPRMFNTSDSNSGLWWLNPLWSLRQQVELSRMLVLGTLARHSRL